MADITSEITPQPLRKAVELPLDLWQLRKVDDSTIVTGSWDGDREEAAVRRWASSDGSGDADKMDWSKFGRAFAVKGEGEKFGDFGFLHHVVRDGALALHRSGYASALAAAHGGRTGQENPEAARHLKSHESKVETFDEKQRE